METCSAPTAGTRDEKLSVESTRTGSPTVLTSWSNRKPLLRTKAGIKIKVIAVAREEKNCAIYSRRNFLKTFQIV